MNREFQIEIEGETWVWDVSKLIELTQKYSVTTYEIPDSFLSEYSWGESHPSEHIHRVLNSDLSCPIIIWDGMVVDGCHRICKALASGVSVIQAVEIINMPPPEYRLDHSPLPSSDKWTFHDVVEIMKAIYSYKDPHEKHSLDF
jgi:hypothetical protein